MTGHLLDLQKIWTTTTDEQIAMLCRVSGFLSLCLPDGGGIYRRESEIEPILWWPA
jgi:hypothetical protein